VQKNISSVIFSKLKALKEKKPLVHNITNFVTIYDCANITKIVGASPVMSFAKEEAEDMTDISDSLVINMGTMTNEISKSVKLALKKANQKSIPIIFDVCGNGATEYRNDFVKEIIKDYHIDVIKGNYSEITKIFMDDIKTKGVDSADIKYNVKDIIEELSKKYENTTFVATGKEDFIGNNKEIVSIDNGIKELSYIVGTGCMTSSLIGAFLGLKEDIFLDVISGLIVFEISSEIAFEKNKSIANLKNNILDEIFNLSEENISLRIKIK